MRGCVNNANANGSSSSIVLVNSPLVASRWAHTHMSQPHLHNCQWESICSVCMLLWSLISSTKMIHETCLRTAIWHFFSRLCGRPCGARLQFQPFLEHHFSNKKKQTRLLPHSYIAGSLGLKCCVLWMDWLTGNHPNDSNQCKSMQVKWPTDQGDISMWTADRYHGKTGAISYRCHHPIQSGQNTVSLSLHIYRKALEQSSVASISQHVKICSEQQSSCGLQRRQAPTSFSFLSTQICLVDMLYKTPDTYQSRLHWILLHRYMPPACMNPYAVWYLVHSLLHVSCRAVLSSQSITHLSTSILLSPMGQKCPSLGQKENKQDGMKGMWEIEGWVGSAFKYVAVLSVRGISTLPFSWSMSREIPHVLISSWVQKAKTMFTDRVTGQFSTILLRHFVTYD